MNLTPTPSHAKTLDIELCRALFEKDPDRLLELVSNWLEANRLTPSEDFVLPAYLEAVLNHSQAYSGFGRNLRVLAS